MDRDLKERLKAEYLAREPNQENSRSIVRELAEAHGLSEAKVRSVLVASAVYVAQPRAAKVASPEQRKSIFDRLRAAPPGSNVSTSELAKEFNLTWDATMEVERQWRSEQRTADVRPLAAHRSHQRKKSNALSYAVITALAVFVLFIVAKNLQWNPRSTGASTVAQSPVASSGSSEESVATSETATKSERDAYSVDLYDKPSGLSSKQDTKYDNLSKEGQEYVDEKMAEYDRMCARSGDC